ncbi:MAG: hypothetical protein CR974_01140 [Gammaproteobacteria bacterium]|nr:MAG: hypothetical protein CR974_01140 [Gammaproteobacteria bacterium]
MNTLFLSYLRDSVSASRLVRFFLTFSLFGLFMTTTYATTNDSVIKSANDQRDYAYSELPNGFKLLVISDKDAQRAAAAVDVGVGSSADPDEFLGLAHFLEHMLFLGTDQYPDPDDYINYISDHGGNHNAYTAFDHTNYFFDIDPKHLHEGLKRFSRFFVAPTMSEKYVSRERNAVNSEFQSKLREDGWRNMDVLKQAINPKHPYSRFNVGNLNTLPEDTVRPALLDFYQQHYSSDRMSAVIIGRESTDTLLKWGEALFADVPKRQVADTAINTTLFDGIKLPLSIKSQSIKNEKNLSVYFQFPYQLDNEYSKSLGYLSYILGYEGEGSLLATLKQLDYASELYAGAGHRIGNETSFEIGVQLTDKGYANTDKVLAVVFAYLDLLRQDDKGEPRYQEIAAVAKTAFRFKEKGNAMHEVSSLSRRLNRFPIKDVQALNATFSGYDKQQIDAYLAQMVPAQAVVQLNAPDITSEEKTHYFKVPFATQSLDVKQMTALAEADKALVKTMHLPKLNPFIADNFELQQVNVNEKHEQLTSGIDLYYKNDSRFPVPRASVQIAMQPVAELSIQDKTAMSLLAALIDEQLTAALYDASIAGVNADIVAGERSIVISLEGYQQKMPVLLGIILKQIQGVTVDSPTFARVKDNYRQDLQNAGTKMPYLQTFTYLNAAVVEDATLPSERLAVLDSIDEKALKAFADKALASMAVRMLVYGNNSYTEAEALATQISTTLKDTAFDKPWVSNGAKVLTDNVETRFDVAHDDNAISYYLQGDKGHAARAEVGLLAKMLEPEFFTQLRTEKQLGYVVFAYARPTYQQAGLAFTVQSPVAGADELEQHIISFNEQFAKSLSGLTEEAFAEVKTILKAELLQKPNDLMSATGQYWSDILTTDSTASSRAAIAKAIDAVEREAFIEKMQALLTSAKHAAIKAVPKK